MSPTTPPIHRWNTSARPRASIHIVHGLAEHGARYLRFAQALNLAGFHVWAHDHRGHGINPVPGLLGHFADRDGWRAVVDDAWAVSATMRQTFSNLPLILFAHSMGSFVAQTLMAEHGASYHAVVLSGSNGPPTVQEGIARTIARVQRGALGGRAPGTWLDRLVLGGYNRRFAPNRTRADWLSRDEAEVDAYLADPRCGFSLSAQAWLDFLDGKAGLGAASHLQRIPKALPVRIISGARDPVGEDGVGVLRLVKTYAEAGLTNVSHHLYPGARHELTNEINRDEVTRELIGWLDILIP